MVSFNYLKVAVFSLLLFLSSNLCASNFVLSDDGLIDKRAISKIEEIGNETQSKLGVNIYVYVQKTLGLTEDITIKDKFKFIKESESEIEKNLVKPYVLLSMAVEDVHVNLIVSSELQDIIDEDEILDDYIIPILASKDRNTLYAKVSSSVLNGYAAVADTIADSKDIKLESSIGNSGKVAGTVWRVLMYTLIVVGLLLYTFAVLRRKK